MPLSNEEKQKIYEEEKIRLEAQEKIQQVNAKETGKKLGKGCVGCMVVFGIIIVVSVIVAIFLPTSKSKPTQNSSVGKESNLFIENNNFIYVCIDKSSYDDFVNASLSKDTYGITNLIAAGKIFSVPNNTRVLIIDRSVGAREIRILEGKNTGKSGWVPMEWVK